MYELILRELLWKAKQHYASNNVVLMGGCALNCSANSLIKDYYKNIWIMPNPVIVVHVLVLLKSI